METYRSSHAAEQGLDQPKVRSRTRSPSSFHRIPSRYQETVSPTVLNLNESLYTPILFWVKIFVIFNSRN